MSNRFDLYAPFHKAIRSVMHATVVQLGRADVDDAPDLAAAIAQTREMLLILEAHLHLEKTFVHPALAAQRPAALGQLADDHEDHERAFAHLRRDLASLELATAEPREARQGRAHRLYLEVSRFVADNLHHMAIEETEINPVLWSLFDDSELYALYERIVASEPPEQLARMTPWLIPALAPEERAHVVRGARRGIPAPVFDQLLGMMQGMLSPADFAKLTTALAAT